MIEVRIRRLSPGTILKLCLFILVPSSAMGVLFGLLALLGFDTVRWGAQSVLGVNGLLLGIVLGFVGGFGIALAAFLLIWAGMAVVSMFKTTKIHYQGPSGGPP